MIQVQKSVPEVYYNQSRDFQFIGRLYEILFNSVKMKADTIYNFPLNDKTDESYVNLLATTLGFKVKHNYSTKQLTAICSIFPALLRNKGNISAIKLAANTLLRADGVTEDFDYAYDENKTLLLFVPDQLTDITLLRDVLTYIIPAGQRCEIIRAIRVTADEDDNSKTIISTEDEVKATKDTIVSGTEDNPIPMLGTDIYDKDGNIKTTSPISTDINYIENNIVARYPDDGTNKGD